MVLTRYGHRWLTSRSPWGQMRQYRIWAHGLSRPGRLRRARMVGGEAMSSGTAAARPRVAAAIQILRDRNERVTAARGALIEVLDGTEEHLTADDIVGRVERTVPG